MQSRLLILIICNHFNQAFTSFLILIDSSSFPAAAAAAKSLQSCPTLCNPIDSSPPGSPVPAFH